MVGFLDDAPTLRHVLAGVHTGNSHLRSIPVQRFSTPGILLHGTVHGRAYAVAGGQGYQ